MNTEKLSLKWGTLKQCDLKSNTSLAAMEKYFEAGEVSAGAMKQRDTAEQKAALCELIDVVDCETIYLDWDSVHVSKEKAKQYVMEYDK